MMSSKSLFVATCFLYGTLYIHYGITTPYMPLWLKHKHFSPEQIAILLSIPQFLKIGVLTPMLTFADRIRFVRGFLILYVIAAVAMLAGTNFIDGFAAMAVIVLGFAIFWDPIPVLADAYVVTVVRARGFDFGRIRLWGSVAVAATSLLTGTLLSRIGVGNIMWAAASCLAIPLLVLPFLPSDRQFAGARPSQKGEWRGLVADRSLVLMILGVSTLIASHAVVNNFSAIQWEAKGFSGEKIGALWALSITAEIATLWFGRTWLSTRPPALLALAGGAAACLRWALMATDPPEGWLYAIQLLQGLTGIAPILAMMIFIERRVAPHLTASAQGLYAPAWSGALGLMTIASGRLWSAYGPGSYWYMAGLSLIGVGVVALSLTARHRAPAVLVADTGEAG